MSENPPAPKRKAKVSSLKDAIIEELTPVNGHIVQVAGRNARDIGLPKGYSLPENLIERFVQFVEDDDWLSLKNEIALLRSMLSGTLESWREWTEVSKVSVSVGEDAPAPPISIKELSALIEDIGKMVERQHRMMYSNSNLVTLEAAAIFALTVASIINRYVKDPEEKAAVLEAIRQLMTAGQGFRLDLEVTRRLIDPVWRPTDG